MDTDGAGGVGSCLVRTLAVPARLCLSACALSGPALEASFIVAPSVTHFQKRLCFNAKGPWPMRQHIKTRISLPNNIHIVRVL